MGDFMKLHPVFVMLFLLVSTVSAQITIHVYNPWIDDPFRQDSINISGTNEVGYHPGTKMESEGGGWFTYTFKVAPMNSDGFNFLSFVGNQYDPYASKLSFPPDAARILFTTLAEQFPGSKEFWVIPDDAIGKYKIYDIPPKSKVIHLFNPWPDNSPQIVLGGSSPKKMRVNTGICGWYTYYFSGFVDSLKNVTFTDYYHKYQYGQKGLMGGSPTLDLTPYLSTGDTIYILPKPFPSGPPSITKSFPERTGECPTRKISAIMRDWKEDNVSFFLDKNSEKLHKGMVQNKLGADGKPVAGTNAALGYGTALGSWFITKENNQTCVDLNFTKGYDGRWEYDSDLSGGFFPIDDFVNPNNIKYPDAYKKQHNFHFTMEMHLQFMYRKDANQEFIFRGDDDVWIFVNNTLAIDLGGMHEPATDTLLMDNVAATLGLTDGGNYSLDIFYAERMPTGSNFLVKTSLDLHNSEELFYKEKLIGIGITEYDIMQLVKRDGIDCGFTPVSNEEEAAIVNFYIDGPQFQDSVVLLSVGTNYGGIIVDTNKSKITLDSAAFEGLAPGEYRITFVSTLNPDRSGSLTFTVNGRIPALLSADPPGGTHFIGNETITLSTDPDARIYYTTDGSEPDTNNEAQLYSGPFTIDKTVTVNAVAIGDIYIPTSALWIYTRDPEKVTLSADPPTGTHYSDSTKITLTASNNALIYFTIDGSTPNVNDSTQLYTAPFTISETVVVKAVATGYYLTTATGLWEYTLDLPAATLEATPGNGTHFGDSLTITLSTNAEAIYYTTDGSTPVVGSQDQLYTGPLTLTGDLINLKAIAVGEKFVSTSKGWTYISDRIPTIVAHPSSCAFSDPITVVLSVNDPDAVIYYTTDGSEPTITSSQYTEALQFSITTQLKARAFANNKVPSAILTENYSRNSIPVEAAYYDRNADGNIDSFYVRVDYKAVGNPDSLTLEVYGIKRTLLSNQLKLSTDLYSVSTIFEPALSSITTKTNDAGSGSFGGRFFDNKGFTIQDKVAPVLLSAVFEPELLEDNMSELGTLKVIFSEPVKTISSKQPLQFLQNDVQYSLVLNSISQSGNNATFSVIRTEGIDFPRSGDKVHIDPSQNVQDVFSNEQNNKDNIYVPLQVLPQPYAIKFQIGPNPFEPDVTLLPSTNEGISITSGVKITADFRADLKSEVGKVNASISIFDAVGNLVCSANREGTESQIIQIKKVTTSKTKVVFVWSGHNKMGRKVGSGTYLANVSVTDPSGKTISKKFLIGVKN
jgi:fibro-slime domain-containing protein